AIRHRSRSTRCNAPMSGCAAGACWRRRRRRSRSSTWTCRRTRTSRPNDRPRSGPPVRLRRAVLIAIAALAAIAANLAAPAIAAATDFYAGKAIQLLIGFSAGGGYDAYGRLLAHHMGRHIPGNPRLVVQNMPGAGSLKAVNYLYNVAPRDGT